MSGSNDNKTSSLRASASSTKKESLLKVVVRKRPPAEDEEDCVECVEDQVQVREAKVKVDLTKYTQTHVFEYDDTFDEDETTGMLYERSAAELIENFYEGGTSTCFCFGQTASGKTFTMFGAGGGQAEVDEEGVEVASAARGEDGGLYMLAAEDVFHRLESRSDLKLNVSMFEIYGQKVRDLLAEGKELAALEDGKGVLQLVGLVQEPCDDMEAFLNVTNVGRGARSTTATDANATSSRSHAAMLLRLVDSTSGKGRGKFSFIDLAGAERGADHETGNAQTKMEGRQINQSLLALKEVIRAKALGRHYAPFRQSRLTQVLEESLTGTTCHTTVIGCVSPADRDLQSTINTLRYAEGLHPHPRKAGSKVKPKPTKAMRAEAEGKEAQAARMEERVQKMTADLEQVMTKGSAPAPEPKKETINKGNEGDEEAAAMLSFALGSPLGSEDLAASLSPSSGGGGGGGGAGKAFTFEGQLGKLKQQAEKELEQGEDGGQAGAASGGGGGGKGGGTRSRLTQALSQWKAAAAQEGEKDTERQRLLQALEESKAEAAAANARTAEAEAKAEQQRQEQEAREQREQQQQLQAKKGHLSDLPTASKGRGAGRGRGLLGAAVESTSAARSKGHGTGRGGRGAGSLASVAEVTSSENTMSHAAKFLQDNPGMRKSVPQYQSQDQAKNRRASFSNPLLAGADSGDDAGAGAGGGSGGEGREVPNDALCELLTEFGEEDLFWKIHSRIAADKDEAAAAGAPGGDAMTFKGLKELVSLGADGVHELGVPRIEAKKLVKRAAEMTEVQRLLEESGVDAGQWFEPVYHAGASTVAQLQDLGPEPLFHLGIPMALAKNVARRALEVCESNPSSAATTRLPRAATAAANPRKMPPPRSNGFQRKTAI